MTEHVSFFEHWGRREAVRLVCTCGDSHGARTWRHMGAAVNSLNAAQLRAAIEHADVNDATKVQARLVYPTVLLRELRELRDRANAEHPRSLQRAVAWRFAALDEWLSKGGDLPDPWNHSQDETNAERAYQAWLSQDPNH